MIDIFVSGIIFEATNIKKIKICKIRWLKMPGFGFENIAENQNSLFDTLCK